jgi:hypothetical protein
VRTTLAAALLLLSLLAGCSGGKDDGGNEEGTPGPTGTTTPTQGTGTAGATTPPVLYLNITAGNATHRFTSASAGGSSPPGSSSASASSSASGTTTSAPANGTGNASGNATGPAGAAPLNVTFELGAARLPAGASARWTLDLGRAAGNATGNGTGNATGNETAARNGTALPATVTHTYTAAGAYNVTFILRAGSLAPQALQATLHINGTGNVSVSKPLPDQVHFEYGESLGCTGDIQGNTCIEWENGPPGGDIDGHWIALGELYWGLHVTSTVTQTPAGEQTLPVLGAKVGADTDCVFVDAALAVIGEGNNGGSSCLGQVPDGAAWMFIYPYANPAVDMTVDFSATPPPAA